MPIDQRKRQKQLARKAAQASRKAKARRIPATRIAVATPGFPHSARTWPFHETLVSDAIPNTKQGTVILSRRSGETIAFAVFLVDTGCMGIKSAFGGLMRASAYGDFLARFHHNESFVQVRPECVRKLVEGAVAYAANLGFSPDPDYHSAKALFGDLDARECDQVFEFGEDGKPFYVSGPNDTPARTRAVMNQLSRKCGGPEGFHFMIASPVGFGDDFLDSER